MDAFEIMLKNVIVFVLLAVPGWLLVKTKLLKTEQSGVLSKTLQYVGVPFLVVKSLMNVSLDQKLLSVIGISALIAIVFTAILYFLSFPLSKLEKGGADGETGETASEENGKKNKARGMMQFCMICANNGFLGIPLAEAVFGAQSLEVVSLVVVNIISLMFFNTFGVYLVSGDKSNIQVKKTLLNPALIAFVVGIAFNLLKVGAHLPEATTYVGQLSGLVTPLCMIILGMKLGDVPFKELFSSWKAYYVAAVKLVLVPVLAATITLACYHLFSMPAEVVFGVFLGFGLPTATLGIVFADNYGGDAKNGVIYTLSNTVLSVVTIPLLYWLIVALL